MASNWIKVVKEKDFQSPYPFTYKNSRYVLFRLDEGIFALKDCCSHEEARLSEGKVSGSRVTCPRHGAGFDIKTGKPLSLPATKGVPSFETVIKGGYIYLKQEED